jgi:hypothetical protein
MRNVESDPPHNQEPFARKSKAALLGAFFGNFLLHRGEITLTGDKQ